MYFPFFVCVIIEGLSMHVIEVIAQTNLIKPNSAINEAQDKFGLDESSGQEAKKNLLAVTQRVNYKSARRVYMCRKTSRGARACVPKINSTLGAFRSRQ